MEKKEYQQKVQAKVAEYEALKKEKTLYAWNNLPHFNEPNDVPNIPLVPKEEYEEFYVPRLIGAGAIPKEKLIDQQVYIGKHRRCTVAKWDEGTGKFMYWRNKFGCVFIETCCHFQDDDGYALFVPIKLGTPKDFEKPHDCLFKR